MLQRLFHVTPIVLEHTQLIATQVIFRALTFLYISNGKSFEITIFFTIVRTLKLFKKCNGKSLKISTKILHGC